MTKVNAYTKLFQELTSAVTVLTPNRRLSATLNKLYQEFQLAQNKQYWQTPDILPVTSWIQRLWRDHTYQTVGTHPLVLNTAQEQFLWEQILTDAKESSILLQISGTADIAKSARGLLQQWRVSIEHPLFKTADDYVALQAWVLAFERVCHENNWVDLATLPNLVCERINRSEIKLPRMLILVGFTELSPQLNYFLSCCKNAGVTIETNVNESARAFKQEQPCANDKSAVHQICLRDSEMEIRTIARWAKQIHHENARATIGCVIPSLDKIRSRVMQIFSEVFADANTYTVDARSSPFNISAGKVLLQYPIIHAALQLLSLHKKNINANVFSYILASPYLGDAERERIRRANFDSVIRQGNVTSIHITQDLEKIREKCPQLATRLQAMVAILSVQPKTLTYREWAHVFNALLSALGWPGERSLNSDEYQIVEAWLNLLSEFSTLDHVTKAVTIYQAMQILYKMASKQTFQPKSPDAPIQVLGVLEAAAIPFDYLWVAGMDDLSWPPQPRPNPFIPKKLQRELNMPHATAERELHFCHLITSQFKRCADHVVFSYADKNDELELQPSPLIRHLPALLLEHLQLTEYRSPGERIYHARALESISDENAGPVTAEEKIRGGTDILKQQALCPFKAFATHRLHARELDERLPGLRPRERGTIVHKTLEIIWNHLLDQATLAALSDEELDEIITASIDTAMNSITLFHQAYTKYISLEKTRLHKLLKDWLLREKERSPFKVINSEKASRMTLNQLELSMRIDRIDELPDGKKLIIDYKTGKNNQINSWFSDRPEEPQLPLYALLDPGNTIGITFAQVAPGECCFKGVSEYALNIDGIKSVSEIKKTTARSWAEQLNHWKTALTALSDQFNHGAATVDPKDPPETCLWCALKPLCRISEEHPNEIN